MGQFRAFSAAVLAAFCFVSAASATDSAATTGKVEIRDTGGIKATGEVIFKDIIVTPTLPSTPMLTTASSSTANLSVVGDASAVSISVPEAVDVLQTGGEESLTVVTAMDGDQATVTGFTSLISPGEILSVDIGGEISVRPEDLAPGEYRGLLVVVAQYN